MKNSKNVSLIWCLLMVCWLQPAMVKSYKILAIFPHQMQSHFATFKPLLESLNTRGHHLTVISHFPRKHKTANYTDVSLTGSVRVLRDVLPLNHTRPESKLTSRLNMYMGLSVIAGFADEACGKGLISNNFRRFVNTTMRRNQFDLILAEFFTSNCYLGLTEMFRAPLIGFSSSYTLPWTNAPFANPDNPAYTPVVFLDYTGRMGFLERVENTVSSIAANVLYKFMIAAPASVYAKKFIDGNVDDVEVAAANASLLLVNTHFALSGARPNVPNVIEIGGIHIGEVKRLAGNIEKWINESKDGVIYFSMGSMIKGHTFPEDKKKIFLRAFGRLKQRVLWKWENETMPFKPDNVMIQKWMPQFDILCHPNVKAFISHGGLLGTTEAVHCGVPVVVMPQFGDQHTNARALEAGGGGVVLNFREADEEMVYKALKTVLDPEFNKKAKELSARFRDRPMSPMDTAIYWIEYVARHKGAHHMRTAAVGMPLYQYLLLDVFGFLALVTLVALIAAIYITKFFWGLLMSLFATKDQKAKKVKKN